MANAQAVNGAGRPPRKSRTNRNRGPKAAQAVTPDPFEDDDDDAERLSRDQEARTDEVHEDYDDDWTPPELLDAPPARPGYVQRWIRTTVHGVGDPRNVAKRMNQRWMPRKPETVPKGYHVPTIQHGQYAGCIGIEGNVLMERPEKIQNKQRRLNREMAEFQMRGVEQDLHRVHDPSSGLGQPSLRAKSEVVRGKPRVADDD